MAITYWLNRLTAHIANAHETTLHYAAARSCALATIFQHRRLTVNATTTDTTLQMRPVDYHRTWRRPVYHMTQNCAHCNNRIRATDFPSSNRTFGDDYSPSLPFLPCALAFHRHGLLQFLPRHHASYRSTGFPHSAHVYPLVAHLNRYRSFYSPRCNSHTERCTVYDTTINCTNAVCVTVERTNTSNRDVSDDYSPSASSLSPRAIALGPHQWQHSLPLRRAPYQCTGSPHSVHERPIVPHSQQMPTV